MSWLNTFRDWHRDPKFWKNIYANVLAGIILIAILAGLALVNHHRRIFAALLIMYCGALIHEYRRYRFMRGPEHWLKPWQEATIAAVSVGLGLFLLGIGIDLLR